MIEHRHPVLPGAAREDQADEASRTAEDGGEDGLRDGDKMRVVQGGDDALEGPEHGAEAKREEHQEEEHGPEGWKRELEDRFREHHEGQAGALSRLEMPQENKDLHL